MKIFNFAWKFGEGGISKCFLTYAKMGDLDKKIEVFSVCIDPKDINYDRDFEPLHKIGAKIISIRTLHDLSWLPKVKHLVDGLHSDVIFCHGFNGPILAAIIKVRYRLKVPVVCSYHGAYYAPTPNKQWLEPVFNGLMLFLYKRMAKKIIAVSFYSKNELIKKGIDKDKIVVVHNGIKDIVPQTSESNNSKTRIGVVSRLDPFKGIDVLIKALSIIKETTQQPFTLDIVGSGPMEEELRENVEKSGLKNNINFVGYQSNIPSWMSKWDIFCLPSFFENHSLSILEAMRSGKAIVTTRVGGNEESVANEKQGLTVPARDEKSLANAILRLINNKDLRKKLGENARKRYLLEFTEEKMKKNLVEVFNTL